MRLIAFLSFSFSTILQAGTILIPEDASKSLQDTAEQFSHWLEVASGDTFEIDRSHRENPGSIRLARAEFSNSETFRIRNLEVSGGSDQAIRHGVYAYLEALGFRWLAPNENWTIVPKIDSIEIQVDETQTPAFRIREFFGTGGFGGNLPVDPDRKLQARWERWKQQNRFGGDLRIAGHTGEAFNTAHREILEAHPEYLAEIDGARQAWALTTKLCASNPEVRKLYIADRLVKLERDIATLPPGDPRARVVSVEPADGGDHCECAECRKIGSVSDRVYFMANEVAKVVAERHPDRLASLLAYNHHAAPPGFSLEPNIYLLATPYAFQRTGLPGDELVKAWSIRTRNLAIYDYWAIPDWANCLPVLADTGQTTRKIRFWHKNHARGFLGESSYSAANVALTWFVTSRLMWDPDVDETAVIDEFYELAFGPAQPPIRQMHQRWARGFVLSEHELALTFRDLSEARQLAADRPDIEARINDLVLYVEYLRRWRLYDESKRDSPERIARADELIRYLWRIYDSGMVHSYRMFQLIALRYERGNEQLLKRWPLKDFEAAAWKDLPEFGEDEIAAILDFGVSNHVALEFEDRKFSDLLVPVNQPEVLSGELVKSPMLAGTHEFEFWIPASAKSLSLRLKCNLRANYPGNLVVVSGPDQGEVFRHTAPSDGEWHELTIPTGVSGNYRMTIYDQKIFFQLEVPGNLPFVLRGWKASPGLPARVFVQVPNGLERLAISHQSVVPLKITNSEGKLIAESSDRLFTVDLEPAAANRVLEISNFKTYTPLRLLNAPEIFAFSRDGLMEPESPAER